MPPRRALLEARLADLMLWGSSDVEVPEEQPWEKITPDNVEEYNKIAAENRAAITQMMEEANEQIKLREVEYEKEMDELFEEEWAKEDGMWCCSLAVKLLARRFFDAGMETERYNW